MTNVDSDMDPVSRSTDDASGCDLARTFDYWSPAFTPRSVPTAPSAPGGLPCGAQRRTRRLLHPVTLRGRQRRAARPRHLHLNRDDGASHTGRVTATGPAARPGPTVAHPLPPAPTAVLHPGPRCSPRGRRKGHRPRAGSSVHWHDRGVHVVLLPDADGGHQSDPRGGRHGLPTIRRLDCIDCGRPGCRSRRCHRCQHGDPRIPRGAARRGATGTHATTS